MSLVSRLLATVALVAFAVGPASAQIRVQVIHNAPDPDAATVDVYINDNLELDNFAFRTATEFLDLPSDTDLKIDVAPGNSASSAEAVGTQTFNLPPGTYQIIASGVLDDTQFAGNPDGEDISFQLLPGLDAQETAADAGKVGVRVVHGSPDAPTVDVRSGGAIIVNDASYTDITGYEPLDPGVYTLDITTADGSTTAASFEADLSGAAGAAVTVLASGFLTPADDRDGPAFGLLAVFADGTEALLPEPTPKARLQVIHNAADPDAAVVDVYINDVLELDDFAFRTATPFIDVPAGVDLEVAVAPGTSASSGEALFAETFNLPEGSTTQLIANGVLDDTQFAANPDGEDTSFQLLVGADAREEAENDFDVNYRVVHGATDAPTVDIRTAGLTLVDDASYTDITGYQRIATQIFTVEVTTADGSVTAGTFGVDFSRSAGAAVTVLASGFLTPADNQNGDAFGLLAVFADGTTDLLTPGPATVAFVQVIHNSADPGAEVVDVYANGQILIDDFAFRTATSFRGVPADTDIEIAIAPGSSTSAANPLFSQTFNLPRSSTAQLIATGVLDDTQFAANPDGEDTSFQLLARVDVRTVAPAGEVRLAAIHGSTDAPTVDVRSDGAILFDDLTYGDSEASTMMFPPNVYPIDVTTADGSTTAASFSADLTGAGGQVVTVLASGFLTPADDQDGKAFGLLAVFNDGTADLLPVGPVSTSGVPQAGEFQLGAPAPNPVAGRAAITFSLATPGEASVMVYDTLGRRVAIVAEGSYGAEPVEVDFDTAGLAAGAYVIRLESAGAVQSRTVTVLR
ncbi:MAG: DUF4397 domain-containing protein [Bacteroidota bacterium]